MKIWYVREYVKHNMVVTYGKPNIIMMMFKSYFIHEIPATDGTEE